MDNRSGTISLLGAGASFEAGYPLGNQLYDIFCDQVQEYSRQEIKKRKQHEKSYGRIQLFKETFPEGLPKQDLLTEKWFMEKWEKFEETCNNINPLNIPTFDSTGNPNIPSDTWRDPVGGYNTFTFTPEVIVNGSEKCPPYLETFFTYFDTLLQPLYYRFNNKDERKYDLHRFRLLKEIAVYSIYHCLNSIEKEAPTYLTGLFSLNGPQRKSSVTISLNQDTSIEHLSSQTGISFYDGFKVMNLLNKKDAIKTELEKLIEKISEDYLSYIGFSNFKDDEHIYVKLHGSLGWFSLEEGPGEIGRREDLRNNITHKHFRLPYNIILKSVWEEIKNELKSVKYQWLKAKPYLIFARANKYHQNPLLQDQMSFINNQLKVTKNILVIGYGWQDAHINDLILNAVAQGANVINVSNKTVPTHVLGLWIQKFPTTFKEVKKRMYMFGGGAKKVLQGKEVFLPNGASQKIDIIHLLNEELPSESSLHHTFRAENQ